MRSVFLTCGFGKSAGVRSAMRCIEGDGDAFRTCDWDLRGHKQPPFQSQLRNRARPGADLRERRGPEGGRGRDPRCNMARPLRGLKVLDLGNFLAGPVVSMHLGAMGADVIKLERITGDDSRAIGPMAADGEAAG